ncbi:MAG: RNA-binding S4 domain-containing protein [Hyphomicrobiaceae bacterium]
MSRAAGDRDEDASEREVVRLDKWLWFARVVKTRTLAAALVEDGKVRINRVKITKPSQSVRVGDVLTVTVGPRVRLLKVLAFAERRGPPSAAQVLFDDLSPPPEPRPSPAAALVGERLPGSGRPTKRERRDMERFKGG